MQTDELSSLFIGFAAFAGNGCLLMFLIGLGLQAAAKTGGDEQPLLSNRWVKAMAIAAAGLTKTFLLLFVVFIVIGRWQLPAAPFVVGAGLGLAAVLVLAYRRGQVYSLKQR